MLSNFAQMLPFRYLPCGSQKGKRKQVGKILFLSDQYAINKATSLPKPWGQQAVEKGEGISVFHCGL
jgi:hypothetical protein